MMDLCDVFEKGNLLTFEILSTYNNAYIEAKKLD
jgi:hypothetical protein